MKILFLTLLDFSSFSEHNIYCDLLRSFIGKEHEVFCISPSERRFNNNTHFEENGRLLKLRIGNTQKTNVIEKGISTLLLEIQFKRAIKKYFSNVKFDLVIYSTPPITLLSAIKYVKDRDNAKTYLLLKDIFPQNAVDLGMMSKSGIIAPIYCYFRHKEKQLYAISDHIGCMSQANADYVIGNNPEIDPDIVEVCPNSIEVIDKRIGQAQREKIRRKYGIPLDKKVFIYGGNLGKPQDISFIIECLKTQEKNKSAYFLIAGNGTDFGKLQAYFDAVVPGNMKLMERLPQEDYDGLAAACDVGMIFLDHRFTIPNFPSRLLGYMQAGIPVLACTDTNTDVGKTVTDGGFGWWCESNNTEAFAKTISMTMGSDNTVMGKRGFDYLKENYSVDRTYQIIVNHM